MPALHHVILDTDIGSDVDDAMALSTIFGTPTVELVGVTTVYGDTLLRARIAQRYASLGGRSIPVHAGIEKPLSGREVWWPGHEGTLHTRLEDERVDDQGAVDFLVQTVLDRPGEINIIAIGPLTNVASAILSSPRFASNVGHLWVMGGAFASTEGEHNFRSDDIAALIVFNSGISATVTGLEITQQVQIRADQLAKIAAAGPLGRAVEADIQQWWKFLDEEWNVPHDPITVLTLTHPHLFEYSPVGTVSITQGGEHAGRSEFTIDPEGSVRIATAVQAEHVSDRIVAAIIDAAAQP